MRAARASTRCGQELLGLLEEQVQRPGVVADRTEQRLGEVGDEADLLGLREQRDVEHAGQVALDDQVGHERRRRWPRAVRRRGGHRRRTARPGPLPSTETRMPHQSPFGSIATHW